MTDAPISPGTYLRLRREAAGLSLDDVASAIATEPRVAALDRMLWLAHIEDDAVPFGSHVVDTLINVFHFDENVLVRLDAIRLGQAWMPPSICRLCACCWEDPCTDDATGDNCAWSDADESLCTSCVPRAGHIAAAARAPAENAIYVFGRNP